MTNDTDVELTIESLGARGDGIATLDGERVFVPFTAPGDRVKVRLARDGEDRLVGRVRALIAPSPARSAPPCPHFGDAPGAGCGGCALQHLAEEAYRTWKLDQLRTALARHDIVPEHIEPMIVSPPGSRRRADFTASRRRDGVVLGFNARGSHRIVDLAACTVLKPALVALIQPLREVLAPLAKTGDSADLRLAVTDSGIDLLLVSAMDLGAGARARLAAFAERHDIARIARLHPRQAGAEPVIERRPVRMVLGDVAVPKPPAAFLQATAEGEAALRAFVVEAARGGRKALDLFSGIGTFTFPLARAGFAVHAVDGGKGEIEAITAAARAAMLPGVSAERRDLFRRPLDAGDLAGVDTVIFDPPRAGAAAQAAALASSRVQRVIAISCNPGSFARDARMLLDGGYRLVRLLPVDQFLWSPHLELSALFLR